MVCDFGERQTSKQKPLFGARILLALLSLAEIRDCLAISWKTAYYVSHLSSYNDHSDKRALKIGRYISVAQYGRDKEFTGKIGTGGGLIPWMRKR